MRRWRLVRCDAEDPAEHASCLAYGPEETPEAALIRGGTTRWPLEEGVAHAQGAVGLDQDEGRQGAAWPRQAPRCVRAHASRVVLRRAGQREERAATGTLIPAGSRSRCPRGVD
jgi:hypothetical protein